MIRPDCEATRSRSSDVFEWTGSANKTSIRTELSTAVCTRISSVDFGAPFGAAQPVEKRVRRYRARQGPEKRIDGIASKSAPCNEFPIFLGKIEFGAGTDRKRVA